MKFRGLLVLSLAMLLLGVSCILDPLLGYYTVSGDGVLSVRKAKSIPEHVEIPSEVNGITVTAIADFAFNGCDQIKTVTIPNTVTTIGDFAFQSCFNLTSISIPASVTSIGRGVFNNCRSLQSFEVDSGNPAFKAVNGDLYSKDLKTLFYCHGSATSLEIPVTTTAIGPTAFSGSALSSVVIPESVTIIGESAFSGCRFTSVDIPSSVAEIGDGAFSSNQHLTTISVASGNTAYTVYDGCLYSKDMKNLLCVPTSRKEAVLVPDGVETINARALIGCSVSAMTLPSSITKIGNQAFDYCKNMTYLTFSGTKSQWNAIKLGYSAFSSSTIKTIRCTDGNISL